MKKPNLSKTSLMILGVISVFVLVVLWSVISVQLTIKQQQKEAKASTSKVMTYGKNTIREEQNGKLIWEVTADETSVNLVNYQSTAKNIRGKFFAKDGRVLELSAPAAVYYPNPKTKKDKKNPLPTMGLSRVVLSHGVKATTSDGDTLTSGSLEWKEQDGSIHAKTNVKITRKDGSVLTANEVLCKENFTKFSAKGKAHLHYPNKK